MTKKKNPLSTKNRKIANLANKALKDTFVAKPATGYKYLEELKPGAMFETQSGLKGILINFNVNAKVIVMDVPMVDPDDVNYYLGKKNIGAKTEVKEL